MLRNNGKNKASKEYEPVTIFFGMYSVKYLIISAKVYTFAQHRLQKTETGNV